MTDTRPPSLLDALIPVVMLMAMLFLSVYLFGDSSSSGPNQIVLIVGAAIASGIAGSIKQPVVIAESSVS